MDNAAPHHRLAWLLAGLLALPGARAETLGEHAGMHAHPASDLVVFVHAEGHHFSGSAPSRPLNEDATAAADIVLAVSRDKLRLFGEYLLSSDEHDIERLQVGYEPVADTVIWLGRYHQPASAWNTEHHHGRYLQTTITRPSVELWEDEAGVLPQHITGLLLESRHAIDDKAGWQFSLGAGLGPTLGKEGLDPLDLLDLHRAHRHVSWMGRVAYQPDTLGASQFGLLAARHHLEVVDPGVAATIAAGSLRQTLYGAFADWRQEPWRVLAAVYDVHMTLAGAAATRAESFTAGYVQVERQLPGNWTVYGREENSNNAGRSSYVAAGHQSFELRRSSVGLRWDLMAHQALTMELARGTTLQTRQSEFRLQWSAAFP